MKPEDQRTRIWRSMRILREFSTATLVATAEASTINAGRYALALCRAGYLRVVWRRTPCMPGSTIYRLVRNTGPKAPMLARDRRSVWDPNTKCEFPVTTKEGPCKG